MGQDLQSILLTYLKVVLTEWEEPYKERAELLMKDITNKKAIMDLFSKVLISKVQVAHHPLKISKFDISLG